MDRLYALFFLMLSSVMSSPKAGVSGHNMVYRDDFRDDWAEEEDEEDDEDEENEETRALIKAAEESAQTGSIRPLLKEELKAKIQLRRLQSGQEEIMLEFKEPTTYEMTIEEIQKRNRKREKNRESALRTRVRQKSHENELQQKIKSLEEKRQRLTEERERLQRKALWKRLRLTEHLQYCHKGCREDHLRQLELSPTSGIVAFSSSGQAVVGRLILRGSDSDSSDDLEAMEDSPHRGRPQVAEPQLAEQKEDPDVTLGTGVL